MKLDALSVETGLPIAEHVRRAIDEYLNKADGRRPLDAEGYAQ